MPATFLAFIILILIGALVLWLCLSRGFEKIGDFILNKVLGPFGFGDQDTNQNEGDKK